LPIYDRRCVECNAITVDVYEPMTAPVVTCECGGETIRGNFTPGASNSVIDDSIPGGIEIRNGLCNDDGSPRRYYSKADIQREATRKGLFNCVRHMGNRGGDKSKHTSRWI
jgi:hypothetical protein